MTFNVRMTAFGKPNEVRTVNVPNTVLDRAHGDEAVLEQVFYYGQNDFQPMPHPSVSMGDVIELNQKLFLCQAFGFKEISKEQFDTYTQIPQRDRTINTIFSGI